ncbi:hypothetical protein [Clostridium hydrogeniformans]|uniref:hypothetical protein n=1 Tax=Clostridium hydrogeniformans TaxID=349933 RepID=UPI000481B91B|nr:hypothetical protein [Clostridium hydrogeniformans]
MKNLFNKALFISKIKEIFFLICLDMLVVSYLGFNTYNKFFIYKLTGITDGYSDGQFYGLKNEMVSNHLWVMFISLLLFSFILLGINKNKEYLFLGHQPFSKTSIIFTKVLILFIILLINVLILNYTYILCYIKYKYIFDYININLIYITIRTFCYDFTISLLILAFCLVINFYVNNGIMAIILELGLIAVFVICCSMVSSKIFSYNNEKVLNTYSYLKNNFSIIDLATGRTTWQLMLISLILGLTIIFLCVKKLYSRLKIEKLNGYFYSKEFLIFLNLILSFSIALGLNLTLINRLSIYTDIISLIFFFFSSYVGLNFLEKKYSLI